MPEEPFSTPKPAATPANAAAIPASGLRPTLLNAAAPRGISTRYPASEAMLERTPIVLAGYMVSRGIAKSGTRSHADDPREHFDLPWGRDQHQHGHDGN